VLSASSSSFLESPSRSEIVIVLGFLEWQGAAGEFPHGAPSLKDVRVGNDLQVLTKEDTETPSFRTYLPCLQFKSQNGS